MILGFFAYEFSQPKVISLLDGHTADWRFIPSFSHSPGQGKWLVLPAAAVFAQWIDGQRGSKTSRQTAG